MARLRAFRNRMSEKAGDVHCILMNPLRIAALFLSHHIQARTQRLLHSLPADTGDIRLACFKHRYSRTLLRDNQDRSYTCTSEHHHASACQLPQA